MNPRILSSHRSDERIRDEDFEDDLDFANLNWKNSDMTQSRKDSEATQSRDDSSEDQVHETQSAPSMRTDEPLKNDADAKRKAEMGIVSNSVKFSEIQRQMDPSLKWTMNQMTGFNYNNNRTNDSMDDGFTYENNNQANNFRNNGDDCPNFSPTTAAKSHDAHSDGKTRKHRRSRKHESSRIKFDKTCSKSGRGSESGLSDAENCMYLKEGAIPKEQTMLGFPIRDSLKTIPPPQWYAPTTPPPHAQSTPPQWHAATTPPLHYDEGTSFKRPFDHKRDHTPSSKDERHLGNIDWKFEPLSRVKKKKSPSSSGSAGAVAMDRPWENPTKCSSSYYDIKVENIEEGEEGEKDERERCSFEKGNGKTKPELRENKYVSFDFGNEEEGFRRDTRTRELFDHREMTLAFEE